MSGMYCSTCWERSGKPMAPEIKRSQIALGPYEDCVYTRRGYIDKRRSYLAKLGNVQEFSEFMGSCFRETVFSDEIKQKMKKIPKFRKCTEAIISKCRC